MAIDATEAPGNAPLRLAVSWLEPGLWRRPQLGALLSGRIVLAWPWAAGAPAQAQAVLGWGYQASRRRAERLAARWGLPCWRLEDGFLRSVDSAYRDQPLSVVVEDLGVSCDASQPSRLEALITSDISDGQAARARALALLWRCQRVSQTNHAQEFAGPLAQPYVLVDDQTFDDDSVRLGLAGSDSFDRMMRCALAEHPQASVLLKVHPDVLAGRKRGHIDMAAWTDHPRVTVLAQDVHPVGLIEQASAVYVVTSQIGFEALLWGKSVRCFGMPFYAGWGLTADELAPPSRRKPVSLAQLVHAALVAYPRYLDPEVNLPCEPERLIEWMGLQRSQRQRFEQPVCAVGFSLWKRPLVRRFLQGTPLRFASKARATAEPRPGESLALWGRSVDGTQEAWHAGGGRELIHLEDGFLRSVGLGADLTRPLSWVLDRRGIYFDATRESELEHLLQNASFDDALLARARALRERIVNLGLTKYNVGSRAWTRPPGNRRVILVPGQVESDASLTWGAPGIRENMELLRAVRQEEPDAWLLYKPHPDVVAGLRKRGAKELEARRWCDELVVDSSMGQLLEAVDEVHVLTSLAGFEALLRGKKVVAYGQPFYSGWGLTEDRCPPPRRNRRLDLDALCAAALILYPTYVSGTTGRYTTPERVLDELVLRRAEAGRLPLWRKALRPLLALRW